MKIWKRSKNAPGSDEDQLRKMTDVTERQKRGAEGGVAGEGGWDRDASGV